jgi:Polyketide cyclase / dehydrase and lipid transport
MTFFWIVLILVAAVLIYAASRPDNFRIARQIAIDAPPEGIFPLINDFRAWGQWSPYERLDPGMKRMMGEITEGKGATYAWEGNGKVGAGNMVLSVSQPSSLVAVDLHMLKPMKADSEVQFKLEPMAHGTLVTWAMDGKQNFIGKLMGLVMNIDRMVGAQFEEGLANLKRVVEKG